MPVSVIVGGQFGSEGKGKVAHYVCQSMAARAAVRVGGTNSGHTVVDAAGTHVFRQLPTAALLPDAACVIPAGAYVSEQVLLSEICELGLAQHRVIVDPKAVIITEEEVSRDRDSGLGTEIGSTGSGTGAAVARRISRRPPILFARDTPGLRKYVRDATPFLRRLLDMGERIVIEGTQGHGLSVLHSRHYPFVTSRDTTAAAFVSEAGLSPIDVDDVVLCIRAFPIRVAGNSGPLPHETTWSEVTQRSGARRSVLEHTTVTRRVRRVGFFDSAVVLDAIAVNAPTRIAMNHLDYVDATVFETSISTPRGSAFLGDAERAIGREVALVGTGPRTLVGHDAWVNS